MKRFKKVFEEAIGVVRRAKKAGDHGSLSNLKHTRSRSISDIFSQGSGKFRKYFSGNFTKHLKGGQPPDLNRSFEKNPLNVNVYRLGGERLHQADVRVIQKEMNFSEKEKIAQSFMKKEGIEKQQFEEVVERIQAYVEIKVSEIKDNRKFFDRLATKKIVQEEEIKPLIRGIVYEEMANLVKENKKPTKPAKSSKSLNLSRIPKYSELKKSKPPKVSEKPPLYKRKRTSSFAEDITKFMNLTFPSWRTGGFLPK